MPSNRLTILSYKDIQLLNIFLDTCEALDLYKDISFRTGEWAYVYNQDKRIWERAYLYGQDKIIWGRKDV